VSMNVISATSYADWKAVANAAAVASVGSVGQTAIVYYAAGGVHFIPYCLLLRTGVVIVTPDLLATPGTFLADFPSAVAIAAPLTFT
jgi:hypothetical protein